MYNPLHHRVLILNNSVIQSVVYFISLFFLLRGGGYLAYFLGTSVLRLPNKARPYMYQHFGEVSGPRPRATPHPNMGARNSQMATLILGGHMGHQIVPFITLSHPI